VENGLFMAVHLAGSQYVPGLEYQGCIDDLEGVSGILVNKDP
jgi:hypothetical protein